MDESDIKREIEKCDRQIILIRWGMPILILMIFVYGDYIDDKVNWFKVSDNFSPYLSVTVEILSAIIGLAIPLALNVIQMIQSRAKTMRLTKDFISEPIYKAQLALLVVNIVTLVLLSLFSWPFMGWFCVVLFTASMICLSLFIRLIHRYVSDLDTYLAERYHQKVQDFFE